MARKAIWILEQRKSIINKVISNQPNEKENNLYSRSHSIALAVKINQLINILKFIK